MSDNKPARKGAIDNCKPFGTMGSAIQSTHYRGMNMHENTEIRREVKSISYHAYVSNRPRYVVIPAGIEFFHVTESATGRVKGFRRLHRDACALARSLEA